MTVQNNFAMGQLRDVAGPAGIINANKHEGVSKAHKVEDIVITGEEKGYKRNRPIVEAPPMNNPNFGLSPSEKKA
ncbi:MAG: hypothetical protein NTZ07_01965 [Candidatus Woesebacteria bacterium]|nr:hypothetical protein [Candidatus Woesebacteria bacterium]